MNGLKFEADASFVSDNALDILWVPGRDPDVLSKIMSDPNSPLLVYIRHVAQGTRWICSVCEGALLLARAELLDGHKAMTQWAVFDCLKRFDQVTVDTTHPRFVVSGNRPTGGGISSGLDEALKLISLVFDEATAEDVQVLTSYFPVPPVCGAIPDTPVCTIK